MLFLREYNNQMEFNWKILLHRRLQYGRTDMFINKHLSGSGEGVGSLKWGVLLYINWGKNWVRLTHFASLWLALLAVKLTRNV